MSGLPSLLVNGSLKAQGNQKQSELDSIKPITYILNWFNDRKNKTGIENRILVLTSQTGSGKSTVLPVEMYNTFIHGSRKRLISLQPTVVTTIEVAKEIAYSGFFPMMIMGQNLGYSTGKNKLKTKEGGVTYATLGTVLMQMKVMTDNDFIDRYDFIIVDEAHKRTVDLEILILLFKSLLTRNKDNPKLPFIIFTSATFNADEILKYFNLNATTNHIFVAGAPTFPKKRHFLTKYKFNNYMDAIVDKVLEIHNDNYDDEKTPKSADILVFLPGYGEITKIKKSLENKLSELSKSNKPSFIILDITRIDISSQTYKMMIIDTPINEIDIRRFEQSLNKTSTKSKNVLGGITDQQQISDTQQTLTNDYIGSGNKTKYIRKVILATETMETGITINSLKYVVESGYFKEMTYDAVYSLSGLIMKPVSQASAIQRFGRVGRKSPGEIYAMYTEQVFNDMVEDKFPEILTTDISNNILTIISVLVENDPNDRDNLSILGFKPKDIDLLQPIPLESLKSAIEKCMVLGMISYNDSKSVLGGDNTLSSNNEIEYTVPLMRQLHSFKLTAIGKICNIINLPLQHSKMILSGLAWNVSLIDLISIATYIYTDSRDIILKSFKGPPLTINWNYVLETSKLMRWLQTPTAKIRERILLGSDFIRGIFLMEAILEIFNGKKIELVHKQLQKFCKKANLNPEGIINMLGLREEIIDSLIKNGINIYAMEEHRFNKIKAEDFINTIIKTKYCIYEGFKLQLAWFDSDDMKYKTQHGNLAVQIPPMFNNDELKESNDKKYGISWKSVPKLIMYDKIDINPNPNKNNVYSTRFNFVEMCDGWIHVDTGLFE